MPEKEAKLIFGKGTIDLSVPETVSILDMKRVEPLPDPEGAVYTALANPIESPPLTELAQGRENACVVISDITRPVPNKIILPPLLQVLEESGIGREKITILIATGMHRPNEGEELESMVGRQIMDKYRIVNHYCREPEVYRKIDEIEGAPIEVNNENPDRSDRAPYVCRFFWRKKSHPARDFQFRDHEVHAFLQDDRPSQVDQLPS
ncbi:MAG: hypothetical protein AMK69_01630 [Nitrospira bacterium SG8_3]|nr:MAG: hypothetical protein AMK69_01630 [Nitrospira bacterium SG8_3]